MTSTRMTRLAGRAPVLFSLAVCAVFLVIVVVAGVASYPADSDMAAALISATAMLLGVLVLLALLNRLGWLESAGVSRVGDRRAWLLLLPFLLYVPAIHVLAVFATAEVAPPSGGLTGALVVENLVDGGLLQEVTFRALVLHALVRAWGSTRGGIARAVAVSAVLFSAVHLLNLAAGNTLSTTLLQLVDTLLAGFYLAVVVLFAKSIWPAVVLHASGNIVTTVLAAGATDFAETTQAWAWLIVLKVPVYVLALYLWQRLPLRAAGMSRPSP